MGVNREFDADLELGRTEAEGVKAGGGLSASVDGVGSAHTNESSGSVSAGGASVSGSDSGSSLHLDASMGNTSAKAGSKRPQVGRVRRRVRRRIRP